MGRYRRQAGAGAGCGAGGRNPRRPGVPDRAASSAGTASGTEQWWVPVLDGTERLGVLRASAAPGTEMDTEAAQDLRNLAGLVALMIVSKRGASDTYARLVRRRRMNVAAEMEWRSCRRAPSPPTGC